MRETYLVSVITPAYNCAKTISFTIESVINQTYSNWEMIVVDDCSQDNTKEIVEEYANIDSRIKLICLKKNSGSAVARNTAISSARGRYIALLDSDDLWKPKKLEIQVDFMYTNGFAFSFTEYDVFRNMTDKRRKVFSVPNTIKYKQYLKNTVIGCLTVIVDKDKIPDFHMETGYLEDILTWMYYLRSGITAHGLKENLASYRISPNTKSSNKVKNAIRYYNCLKIQPEIGLVRKVYSEICYLVNATGKRILSRTTVVD